MIPGKVLTPDGDMIWFIGFGNSRNGGLPNSHDLFQEGTMLVTHSFCHSPCKAAILIFDCKQISSHFIQDFLASIPKTVPLYFVNTGEQNFEANQLVELFNCATAFLHRK